MAVRSTVPSRFDETSELAGRYIECREGRRARLRRAREWLARADRLTWELEELMERDVRMLSRTSPLWEELRVLCRACGRDFHPVKYLYVKEALDALFERNILSFWMLEVAALRHLLPGDNEGENPCQDG